MTKKEKVCLEKMHQKIEEYHEDTQNRIAALESICKDLMKERKELWELNKKLRQYWAEAKSEALKDST